MNALLNRALERVLTLPPEDQDEIARVMLSMVGDDEPPEPVDPTHLAALLEGLRQADDGCFATPAQVSEALARFDR